MARFRPSELNEYLQSLKASPKKGLSQNFLIDANILAKIVRLAEVSASDTVVEIGPGPGALTEKLLETGARVIAIEKDALFAKGLQAMNHPNLQVVVADFLECDVKALVHAIGKEGAKIVANLPYHLTTPMLYKIARLDCISSATLMVQEEAARRFLCEKGTKNSAFKHFGFMNIVLQYYGKLRYGFKVSASCFYPAPHVESAVVRFDYGKEYPVSDEARFFELVELAFSMRRKMVKKSLAERYDAQAVVEALLMIGKEPTCRPDELSCQDWARFYFNLTLLFYKPADEVAVGAKDAKQQSKGC